MSRGRPPLDLTGQRFGRLVVFARAPTLRYSRWHCRCDCGTELVVSLQLLRMGKRGTRSCGCLHREQASENMQRLHAAQRLPQYRREQRPAPCALAQAWTLADPSMRRFVR
jgi:hypothetical protein